MYKQRRLVLIFFVVYNAWILMGIVLTSSNSPLILSRTIMGPHMHYQIPLNVKHSITNFTLISPISSVNLFMFPQVMFGREMFATLFTRKPHTRVPCHMIQQRTSQLKPNPALGALVWWFACVDFLMRAKSISRTEGYAT